MTAKPEVLQYARSSFAYIRRGIQTIGDATALEMIPHPFDPQKTKVPRLGLVAGYAGHGWEHYGQVVVYQRMNGVVPPPGRSS